MIINCPDCNGKGIRRFKVSCRRCARCKGTGKAWVSPYSEDYCPNLIWTRMTTISLSAAAEFDLDAILLAEKIFRDFGGLPTSLPSPFIT